MKKTDYISEIKNLIKILRVDDLYILDYDCEGKRGKIAMVEFLTAYAVLLGNGELYIATQYDTTTEEHRKKGFSSWAMKTYSANSSKVDKDRLSFVLKGLWHIASLQRR